MSLPSSSNSSPSDSQLITILRCQIGGDVHVHPSGRARNPTPALRPRAVPHNEKGGRIAPAAVVGVQSLEDVALRPVEPPLLHLNGSVRQMRASPKPFSEVRARNAQFAGSLGDVDSVTAQNLNNDIRIQMLNTVGSLRNKNS